MKFKPVAVLLGAVVASSFPLSARFSPSGVADAADAVRAAPPPDAKVPEFVPVVNFSEFVLAMQTFAAQNPPASRIAAEALSAKFAFNSGAQEAQATKSPQQLAVQPATPSSVIVTRPVALSSVPAASDPSASPPPVPDPVKIVTGYSDEQPVHRKRHKTEKTAGATPSKARGERPFEPAMGLGMTIDSAEEAPPMSAMGKTKAR